jgi:hypothetical protein
MLVQIPATGWRPQIEVPRSERRHGKAGEMAGEDGEMALSAKT